MRRVVLQCWKRVLEPDERAALTNFVGFLLLPGVVSVMRGVKGGERPLDFLIAASREDHPGMTVINKAKALRARHSHALAGPGRHHPTTQQLAQRVDGLVDEGRFSAAAVVVGQIAAKMRGGRRTPPRFQWRRFGSTSGAFIQTPTPWTFSPHQQMIPRAWS